MSVAELTVRLSADMDQMKTSAVKAAFEVADATEFFRISSGIRDPWQWVKRRAQCRGRHADAFCRGCYAKIQAGASIVWEEDMNCAIRARRHHYWHPHCHPDWVNREYERLRKDIGKRVASGDRIY
jgi:hypothetical protein